MVVMRWDGPLDGDRRGGGAVTRGFRSCRFSSRKNKFKSRRGACPPVRFLHPDRKGRDHMLGVVMTTGSNRLTVHRPDVSPHPDSVLRRRAAWIYLLASWIQRLKRK